MSVTTTVPSCWAGCESCYSNGRLVGHWFPITEIASVGGDEIHRGSGVDWRAEGCEEYVAMDTDSMPVSGELSLNEAARWGEIYEEVGAEQWPALCDWVRSGSYAAEGDTDYPVLADFEDAYCGQWDSFTEYAEQLADDIGLLNDVPEGLQDYFDWASWTRDLAFDYTVMDVPGSSVFVFRSN